MGAHLEAALIERLGQHRHVGDIRGRGLFWAVEFVADRARASRRSTRRWRCTSASRRRRSRAGSAIYPMGGTIDGVRGNHVIIAPPYIATEDDIAAIVARLGEAVAAACSGRRRMTTICGAAVLPGHRTQPRMPPEISTRWALIQRLSPDSLDATAGPMSSDRSTRPRAVTAALKSLAALLSVTPPPRRSRVGARVPVREPKL